MGYSVYRRQQPAPQLPEFPVFSTRQGNAARISGPTLSRMVKDGRLLQITRGVYCDPASSPVPELDVLVVALRTPSVVFSASTALFLRSLLVGSPAAVSVALRRGTSRPEMDFPPLKVRWVRGAQLRASTTTLRRSGIELCVSSPARALAEAFADWEATGLETCLDALRATRWLEAASPDQIRHEARVCGVEGLVSAYLDTVG